MLSVAFGARSPEAAWARAQLPPLCHPYGAPLAFFLRRLHSHEASKFYMRKVKFTQQTLHDKLTQILTDFPVLDVRLLFLSFFIPFFFAL